MGNYWKNSKRWKNESSRDLKQEIAKLGKERVAVSVALSREVHAVQSSKVASVPLRLLHFLLKPFQLAFGFGELPVDDKLEVPSY